MTADLSGSSAAQVAGRELAPMSVRLEVSGDRLAAGQAARAAGASAPSGPRRG